MAMKNWLGYLDKNILRLLKLIGQKADALGLEAFVVGGVVRDIILNKENLDLDVVLESDAVNFAHELSQEYNASLIVYKQFKTATIVLPNGLRVDFSTARKESYPHPGDLPVVSAGSIHDDLFRRDFTINAMAIQLNQKKIGQLRDDFDGMRDLKKKRIRILHDQSFIDDPTRILRAVRFEQRLNFQIEKKTLYMLKLAVKQKAVNYVKPPRYFEEFKKILNEQHPRKSLKRLKDFGGLDFLDLKFKDFSRTLKLMERLEKIIEDYKSRFSLRKPIEPWILYFFAVLDGMGNQKLKPLFLTFNLKNTDRQKVLSCKNISVILEKLSLAKNVPPSRVFQSLKPLSHEAILFLQAKAANSQVTKHTGDFFSKYEDVRLNIDGSDLASIGIPVGKKMGVVLKKILYAKIDGLIKTREDELNMAKKFI